MSTEGALVIYGRGADLGNFQFFADDLVTTELKAFSKKNIVIRNIERRDALFDLLKNPPFAFKLKEFHIYSHAFGAGLALGYKDPALLNARTALADRSRGGRATYVTVLNTEKGMLFTDDLIRAPYRDYAATVRALFAEKAKIKIWGCNSGVSNWTYSDEDDAGNLVYDLDAPASYYYWRALNEQQRPKPSIAQAFANYFRVTTYGATSGSSIQVLYQGRWVSSPKFLQATGRRFVTERDVLRLGPDRGNYVEYKPQ
jgi:hypothetical protein